jgi:uncharacterized membrane protein
MVKRLLRHLFVPDWVARRAFPPSTLRQIENAVKLSERLHRGEIRFVVEATLPPSHLKTPLRKRAREVFAQLNVWDTEENSGVLIYVQLVDRRIEIVADRGIAKRVAQHEWDAICREMEVSFRHQKFEDGSVKAIQAVTSILAREFPARGANPNELPDKPIVL